MKSDYKLIRIWGHNGGSSSAYIEEQVAAAKAAKAPQTALYYRSKEQHERSQLDRSHRGEWIDPKTGNVWMLYDEYLPSGPRLRLDQQAHQRYSQSLSQILKEIGHEERERVYADVVVKVTMEVDIDAWMTEHDVDRALALEQIRNDVTGAIKQVFMHDRWTGLVDDVEARLAMEA